MKKKNVLPVLVIIMGLLLVYCGKNPASVAKKDNAAALTPKMVLANGDAYIYDATGKKRRAGSAGAAIEQGTTIETEKGTLKIEVAKGMMVAVESNTKAKVEEMTSSKDGSARRVRIKLLGGKLRSKIKKLKKGEQFEVNTSVLTAGIRGTEYEVSVAENNASTVMCLNGSVKVDSRLKKQSVNVGPLEKVTVEPHGRMLPKEKMTKEEIESLANLNFDEFTAGVIK